MCLKEQECHFLNIFPYRTIYRFKYVNIKNLDKRYKVRDSTVIKRKPFIL